MDVAFRDASPSEDAHLSRILYNAFLPIWNHNWIQCLSNTLEPISTDPTSQVPLSTLQSRRLAFYRCIVALTRDVGGTISVAESLPSAPVHTIAAVLLFLPPHVRSSPLAPRILWNAGFLGAMWGYGPRGIYRILGVFGANADRMFGKALSEFGLKAEQCGFVQTIARNPEWKGERGAAGQLLQWEMKRFWRGGKSGKGVEDMGSRDLALVRVSVPVILDTSTESAMRVYERLGFRLIGECKIDTGTDGMGLKAEGKEASEQANRVCRQRFMLAMPEWTEFVLDETK